jgi:ABC-type multidrug transport system ATPase subunit
MLVRALAALSCHAEKSLRVGLVPQELTTDAFETVWATVNFSCGLWGKPPNPDYVAKVLESLALLERKNNLIRTLSGASAINAAVDGGCRLLLLGE